MKQNKVLEILKAGHNVFLTGPAGSGKTFLLNKYIKYLKENKVGVAVTASTGIAATHIGGRTIHSWAGIGIKDSLNATEIKALTKKTYLKKQFETVSVLIIDEISMLHAHRLDMVNKVCQAFKRNNLPFGGIQVIMAGDFFQLPPVSRGGEKAEFAYNSRVWLEMELMVCYLNEQYRYKDKSISQILKSMRTGVIDSQAHKLLFSRLKKKLTSSVKPIKLFTHNVDVDTINTIELGKIKNEEHEYKMTGSGEKRLLEFLKKNCLAPEKLVLKVGAQVMFVKNKFKDEETVYVNGSMGTVIGFNKENFPIVRLVSGKEVVALPDSWTVDDDELILAKITQVPLRLAWAITVHKSQGMTLEVAEIDLSRSFDFGMGYVALSRLTSLEGLCLLGINEMACQLNPQVFAYDREFLALSENIRDIKPKIIKNQGSLL
ncbi:MAG: AAA family ATPase [Candidatus Pacebacteria bacterium]|nr:AAA family ATPase [Candidatus Paceibacterota bacterium]